MTVFLGVLIIAALIALPIVVDIVWPEFGKRRVENVKPPESVNAFMGREPDTSAFGYAIWVTADGDLAWCPYVRPAAPVDNPGDK